MKIEQFYDEALSHASYAICSEGEVALIDPARNPDPYYDYARENQAKIVAILETHPHADFVSSHLELHKTTGAAIYVNELLGAEYPHSPFNEGDSLKVGAVRIQALHTPGHSPDSNSYLLFDAQGKAHSLFTGDTLFVGDVGRPDLRENVGNTKAEARELARELFRSTREKIMPLDPEVRVYPAHGAGSLCGRNISADLHSTIGRELQENYALQDISEDEFVDMITQDQPWVPAYFEFDVALNRAGAEAFEQSIRAAGPVLHKENLEPQVLLVDTRSAGAFRKGHIKGAFNLPESKKFETWLGAVVRPGESFYLLGETEEKLKELMERVAKIGYEQQVKGLLWGDTGALDSPEFDLEDFKQNPDRYHVLDVRNDNEVLAGKVFSQSISIPLHRLRGNLDQLPVDKPLLVHCAGGLRSAIASSIIGAQYDNLNVLDMGEHIKSYN